VLPQQVADYTIMGIFRRDVLSYIGSKSTSTEQRGKLFDMAYNANPFSLQGILNSYIEESRFLIEIA
jgi:hypothetical protein